ncbi:MAG: tetratricopeptide repeat protein [Alphaproteobacteria bacterium]
MRNTLLAALTCFLLFNAPAFAGYDEGSEAYKQGDYQAAYREWLPLAEQGDAKSQNKMGVLYATGRGVQRDPQVAMSWFLKAAEQGYLDANINIGRMFEQGHGVVRDLPKAYLWYHMASSTAKGKSMRERLWREMSPKERKEARRLRGRSDRFRTRAY